MTGDYTFEQAKAAIKAANPNAKLSGEGKWSVMDDLNFTLFIRAEGTRVHRTGAIPSDPYGVIGARMGFGMKGVAPKWVIDLLTADQEAVENTGAETETSVEAEATTETSVETTVPVADAATPVAEADPVPAADEGTSVAQESASEVPEEVKDPEASDDAGV